MAKLQKKGQTITPVQIEGRTIASTFWGKAWCDNLESYMDYANRLPRGRTYVRNGSVVDLQIAPGKITAMVSGSELYQVTIDIEKLPHQALERRSSRNAPARSARCSSCCTGASPTRSWTIMTDRDTGLFPAPAEIT